MLKVEGTALITFELLLACLDLGLPRALSIVDTHPKYARVDGDIETVWQRPKTTPKGVFFIAHGCQHQGTDIFSDVGSDGWKFEECSSSNFGSCLGLPQEVSLQRLARSRGYIVMAVSGGSGQKSCWYPYDDVSRVSSALRHVLEAEGLPLDTPVLATGASSGGAFTGFLAASEASGGVKHLKCIVPQIMSIRSSENRGVPTLFVHMPRDARNAARVVANIKDLQSRGIRVAEIRVQPVPVTTKLLQQCLSADQAALVLRSLQDTGQLDGHGFLKDDPRAREWVNPVRNALPNDSTDTLVPDESCLAEVMNVAWAMHEFTSQYASQMLDFCEGTGVYAAVQETAVTQQTHQQRESNWKSALGEVRVQEFGSPSQPLAIAFHGMSSSQEVIHEWDAVAQRLSEIGYYVLIPDWHSNPRTKPGVVKQEQLSLVLKEFMRAKAADRVALLLGKSWGGGMAAGLATEASLHVQLLVLVAPAGLKSSQPFKVTCPTALFWAEDDPVIPISTVDQIPGLRAHVALHTMPSGGHRVLPAYVDLIAQFAGIRPQPVMQESESAAEMDSRCVGIVEE